MPDIGPLIAESAAMEATNVEVVLGDLQGNRIISGTVISGQTKLKVSWSSPSLTTCPCQHSSSSGFLRTVSRRTM